MYIGLEIIIALLINDLVRDLLLGSHRPIAVRGTLNMFLAPPSPSGCQYLLGHLSLL